MRKKAMGRPISTYYDMELVEELVNIGMQIRQIEKELGYYMNGLKKHLKNNYIKQVQYIPKDHYHPPQDF